MTSRTAANRYARALLEVAVQEGADLARVETDLTAYVELFDRFPALGRALVNPAVPVPRKRATVTALAERLQSISIVGKLLGLLADRDRLVLLPEVLAAYSQRLLDYRNVVRARVTTSAPLTPDDVSAIQTRLAQVTGRTVLVETAVDPSIIGGMVARIGGTIYDASLTGQLQRMRHRLIESV